MNVLSISGYMKEGKMYMIFSLIAAGTVTVAQLLAHGVTISVVTYSIAKTGKKVRALIW